MVLFFEKIFLDNEYFEFGFLFFLKQKILVVNMKLNRTIIIYLTTIQSFYVSPFFSQKRLLVAIRDNITTNIIGFNYQDWGMLEFLIKKIFLKIISPTPPLFFFLQGFKAKNNKFSNYTMWEKSSINRGKSLEKSSLFKNLRLEKIFKGFYLRSNWIVLVENSLPMRAAKLIFTFPYFPYINKGKKFTNVKHCFQLNFKKKKIFLNNFKRSLLYLRCSFINFREISFKTIFLNCQQRIIFSLAPLKILKNRQLKKMEFSFLSRDIEHYESDLYFFKKNFRIFSRKIFTIKPWLVWVTLSHQLKETPVKIIEIYKTF